ncbi:MAG: glycosyltransferase family 39 protein, partial [Solirubrobacteraceae bacterium]
YYVAAAQIIAGEPAGPGNIYAGAAPSGADPNAEHPQLGKLLIAGGIELLGNNASGWRVGSVVFGVLSLALLWWLVVSAGGSAWLGLGAAALGAAGNLWLVHARIAVLDVYVVPFMLAAVAFHLRGRPAIAGAMVGIGCCVKEFALYALFVILALELLTAIRAGTWRRGIGRAALAAAVALVSFVTLLSALDSAVPPYHDGRAVDPGRSGLCADLLLWRDGCSHFLFMAGYAEQLRGERGIAAAPTEFWLDRRVIPYYVTTAVSPGRSGRRRRTVLDFRGEINRVLLFTAWPALALCLFWGLRRRDRPALLAVAWALGTWVPPELSYLLADRTTYLYYMVVTMPALYVAVARLLSWRRIPWLLAVVWVAAFLVDAAALYPLRTLSGH